MSSDVAEAPALTPPVFEDVKERIEEFNKSHTPGVRRDFSAADKYFDRLAHKTVKGRVIPLRLTITPNRLAYRDIDRSFVHEDFDAPGCEKIIWIRNLYRSLCPAGTRVEFSGDTMFKVNCGATLEDVFMPIVSFVQSVPTSKSHRRS